MKVQSTGLGKTVMVARFKHLFQTDFDDREVLQLTMEAMEPLHWTIKVYMEPKDVRRALRLGLRPSIIWKVFLSVTIGRFRLFGGSKRSRPQPSSEGVPSGPVSASQIIGASEEDIHSETQPRVEP